MNNRNRHNNDKPDDMRNMAFDGFEDDLLMNERDRYIFDTISNYMRGQSDIDDILNDPELQNTRNAVEAMMSDYTLNSSRNKDNENFIKDIFAEKSDNQEIEDEMDEINLESKNNDIYRITAEWVDSFNSRKEKGLSVDRESEERRNFITTSTKSGEVNEPSVEYIAKKRRGISRRLVIKYISFSAAAVLSAFIIIKSLSPSGDPEKLFDMYYEPMNAVSPVTRGVDNSNAFNFNSAIADYKSGDYQGALSGFSEAVAKNPSSVSASFFLGLSQIELNNYDQAIKLLTSVINNAGEYGKEAHWYLGMVYLKTGEKEKASEYFKYLAKSEGFYSERSAKILRYLK